MQPKTVVAGTTSLIAAMAAALAVVASSSAGAPAHTVARGHASSPSMTVRAGVVRAGVVTYDSPWDAAIRPPV